MTLYLPSEQTLDLVCNHALTCLMFAAALQVENKYMATSVCACIQNKGKLPMNETSVSHT